MNREQTKILKGRLSSVHANKIHDARVSPSMPSKVAAAKRVFMRWQERQSKKLNGRRDRINAAYSTALNAVMFEDDPKVVLLAIQKFERFVP